MALLAGVAAAWSAVDLGKSELELADLIFALDREAEPVMGDRRQHEEPGPRPGRSPDLVNLCAHGCSCLPRPSAWGVHLVARLAGSCVLCGGPGPANRITPQLAGFIGASLHSCRALAPLPAFRLARIRFWCLPRGPAPGASAIMVRAMKQNKLKSSCSNISPDSQAHWRGSHDPRIVASHPERGWSLLCNGVAVSGDADMLLPDGRALDPRRQRHAGGGHARRGCLTRGRRLVMA